MSEIARETNCVPWRWAVASGATMLGCYAWWAAGLPAFGSVVLAGMLVLQVMAFLAFPPWTEVWPVKVLLAGMLIAALAIPTTSWDARSTWLFHAKRMYLSGDFYAQLDGYTIWSHCDYPNLMPALSASLAKGVGTWNEIFPKLSNVLIVTPPLIVLTVALRSLILQLILASIITIVCGRSVINGYLDGPVALYFAASAVIMAKLARLDETPPLSAASNKWLGASGLVMFASLTLLKNEGLVALMSLTLAATLVTTGPGRISNLVRLWAIVLVALIPLVCWKVACGRSGIVNDLTVPGMTQRLVSRMTRPEDLLAIASALLLRVEIIIPAAALVLCRRLTGSSAYLRFTFVALLLYGGALGFVYLSTPFGLESFLQNSAGRVVLPVVMLLCFMVLKSFPGEIFFAGVLQPRSSAVADSIGAPRQ